MADEGGSETAKVPLLSSTTPLDVETATATSDQSGGGDVGGDAGVSESWRDKYSNWKARNIKLPRKVRLHTEENARRNSQWAVNFNIMCAAINTKMLNPNFAIMCTPGASEDSFESTEPFGFNSATYFLPLCTLIGVAISSVFVGTISDRVGRKIILLILGWVSAVGSVAKYFARGTFWSFCIVSFIFGFFLGNLPVGMAYVGDVETSKKRKNDLLGMLVGFFVLGNSGGGIIAVLMNDSGLFAPLWIGAALMVVASIGVHVWMIEPGDARLTQGLDEKFLEEEEDEDEKRPETIDKKTMYNIVGGALLDNIGSTALFPLCLSPLAIEAYYAPFAAAGEEPIMSITGYQWLSVCVALLVIPATQMTPHLFERIGVAATCVFGNCCTAVVTGLLLWIGNMPPTELGFGMFVFVMYAGFPFTVFSQLTTGPMLDVIAPEDKIGYVQGLNNSAMNFGMALAPWAFGVLADMTSTNIAIWTGIAFSIFAALANSPLMWHKSMGKPKPKIPVEKRKIKGEDEETVQRILDGEFVDPEQVFEINLARGKSGRPALVPRVVPYDEEKDNLDELKKVARANFKFRRDLYDRVLAGLSEESIEEMDVTEFCNYLNAYTGADQELMDRSAADLGQWMGTYLEDNGYSPHTSSVLMKQMFISSFPPLTRDKSFTPENVEETVLKARKIMSRYVDQDEADKKKFSRNNVLATVPPIFYS